MTGERNRVYKLLQSGMNDGNSFLPNSQAAKTMLDECLELYSRDYICTTIDNAKGALCSTYPVQLIIPLKQKQGIASEKDFDEHTLKQKIVNSLGGRFARTRGRFPTPVLMFRDKFVCRSSTLARSPEVYSRTGYDYFMQGEISSRIENGRNQNGSLQNNAGKQASESSVQCQSDIVSLSHSDPTVRDANKVPSKSRRESGKNKELLIHKARTADIALLKTLKVDVICDLMVENKKVKFGMNVTSSEKVDAENRYRDFNLCSIPYPGCEFFADYSQKNYTSIGLKFDWEQAFVDAELQVPDNIVKVIGVDWKDYTQWDLVNLTQNYLKLLINCIAGECFSGLLLHCISGWDRTPLFISLLRLSLWADGLIHQSLSTEEIVYLTLAYDWLLFSHQFSDRVHKNEEIMHFCFDFLKTITSEEFSALPLLNSLRSTRFNSIVADEVFVVEDVSHSQDTKNNANNGHFADVSLCNGLQKKSNFECEGVMKSTQSDNGNISTASFSNSQEKPSPHSAKNADCCIHKIENSVPLCGKKVDNLQSSPTPVCNSNMMAISTDQTNTNYLPCSKSEPINVPSSKKSQFHRDAATESNTVNSSQIPSRATSAAEPGSSWHYVSTPSPQNEPLVFNRNHYQVSDSSSEKKTSLGSDSHSVAYDASLSPCEGATEVLDLKNKLLIRKDKLEMAQTIMIPAYCAVIQRQKQRQGQMGLSGMFGTILNHFVKRG